MLSGELQGQCCIGGSVRVLYGEYCTDVPYEDLQDIHDQAIQNMTVSLSEGVEAVQNDKLGVVV